MSDTAPRPARSIAFATVALALVALVVWLIWPRESDEQPAPVLVADTSLDAAESNPTRAEFALEPDEVEPTQPPSESPETDEPEPKRADVEGTENDLVTIRGRVVDVGGRGIEDVQVRASVQLFPLPRRTMRTYTDADGHYVFDQVLPGRFLLRYVHFDYCTVSLHPKMVALGDRIELEDVCLYVGARVRGVLRVDGKPSPGMTIHALAERDERLRGKSRTAIVRAEGKFSFAESFAPGRYRVLVSRTSLGLGMAWTGAKARTIVKEFDVMVAQREVELAIELQSEVR